MAVLFSVLLMTLVLTFGILTSKYTNPSTPAGRPQISAFVPLGLYADKDSMPPPWPPEKIVFPGVGFTLLNFSGPT